jgi:hypothetical protein
LNVTIPFILPEFQSFCGVKSTESIAAGDTALVRTALEQKRENPFTDFLQPVDKTPFGIQTQAAFFCITKPPAVPVRAEEL